MEITNIFINVVVSVFSGAAGCAFFVWLWKKWISHWFNKDLALKTAQFNVLLPEQKIIAEVLYGKILNLQQSTKLNMELLSALNKQIGEIPMEINDGEECKELSFTFQCVDKKNISNADKVFSVEELGMTADYIKLKDDVKSYFEQKAIFLPSDIINNINSVLTYIEMFLILSYPKEMLQYILNRQNKEDDNNKHIVIDLEDLKKSMNFDEKKAIQVIDVLFIEIQNQFRVLLGVK